MYEAQLLRRWMSVLRVVTGGIFVYLGSMHVLGGWAMPDVFSRITGQMAAGSPFGWYATTMSSLVLTVPAVFGPLFAFGMVATGLGLVFGAFTRVAIVAGVWLNLNNFLIGFSGGPVHHGINVLMMVLQIAIWHTGAWRWYSLDGWLGRRHAYPAETARASAHA